MKIVQKWTVSYDDLTCNLYLWLSLSTNFIFQSTGILIDYSKRPYIVCFLKVRGLVMFTVIWCSFSHIVFSSFELSSAFLKTRFHYVLCQISTKGCLVYPSNLKSSMFDLCILERFLKANVSRIQWVTSKIGQDY